MGVDRGCDDGQQPEHRCRSTDVTWRVTRTHRSPPWASVPSSVAWLSPPPLLPESVRVLETQSPSAVYGSGHGDTKDSEGEEFQVSLARSVSAGRALPKPPGTASFSSLLHTFLPRLLIGRVLAGVQSPRSSVISHRSPSLPLPSSVSACDCWPLPSILLARTLQAQELCPAPRPR